jgi:TPR repeat protein
LLRAAIARGDSWAAHALALAYEDGRDVKRSPRLAFTWMRRAAAQVIEGAAHALGCYHANGFGTPRNEARAVH